MTLCYENTAVPVVSRTWSFNKVQIDLTMLRSFLANCCKHCVIHFHWLPFSSCRCNLQRLPVVCHLDTIPAYTVIDTLHEILTNIPCDSRCLPRYSGSLNDPAPNDYDEDRKDIKATLEAV